MSREGYYDIDVWSEDKLEDRVAETEATIDSLRDQVNSLEYELIDMKLALRLIRRKYLYIWDGEETVFKREELLDEIADLFEAMPDAVKVTVTDNNYETQTWKVIDTPIQLS